MGPVCRFLLPLNYHLTITLQAVCNEHQPTATPATAVIFMHLRCAPRSWLQLLDGWCGRVEADPQFKQKIAKILICTGLAVLFNRRANIFLSCRYFCRHSRPDVKCWNARGSAELGGGWRGQWFCVGVWWPHLLAGCQPGSASITRVTCHVASSALAPCPQSPGLQDSPGASSPAQPVSSRLLVCSRTGSRFLLARKSLIAHLTLFSGPGQDGGSLCAGLPSSTSHRDH